jgi:hypothetical protein
MNYRTDSRKRYEASQSEKLNCRARHWARTSIIGESGENDRDANQDSRNPDEFKCTFHVFLTCDWTVPEALPHAPDSWPDGPISDGARRADAEAPEPNVKDAPIKMVTASPRPLRRMVLRVNIISSSRR